MLLTGWMLSKSGWMLPFNNQKGRAAKYANLR